MLARIGNVIYWLGGLAGALFLYNALDNKREMVFYIIGGGLCLIVGWAIRYIISGNKSLKP